MCLQKIGSGPDAYDAPRSACPVTRGLFPGISVLGHAEVTAILEDPETFSNAVSAHLSVPNGMDPPQHRPFRKLIEPYFSAGHMAKFEPQCRMLAVEGLRQLPENVEVDFMQEFARSFAVGCQCSFLGWPERLRDQLWTWLRSNQEAVAAGDRERLSHNAREFELLVLGLLEERRRCAHPPEDVTTSLLREQVEGRPLQDAEIVSILRNWTAGEVGTISASVGILAGFLAAHAEIQFELRVHPERIGEAVEEILRLHAPLLTNRRTPTCPVRLGSESLSPGDRLTLVWAAANRDPAVFAEPGSFQWNRNPADNLLWGRGIHVCPGAPLARLELRVFVEELLRGSEILPIAGEAEFASPPGAGYDRLPLRFSPRPREGACA
jgi:cytochrome P450